MGGTAAAETDNNDGGLLLVVDFNAKVFTGLVCIRGEP